MQFKALLLFAGGLSAAAAWTVPAGQPDGVYEVSVDALGNEVHTLLPPVIEPFVPRGASTKRNSVKRTLQGPEEVTCGGNSFSDFPGTVNDAVGALKAQCNQKGGLVLAGRDFYATGASMVVYFCNFSQKDNHCYADEIEDALANKITGKCGSYQSGWDIVVDRAAQYGYEDISAKFCGRGR